MVARAKIPALIRGVLVADKRYARDGLRSARGTGGNAIEADGLKSAAASSVNGTKFDDANRNAVFDVGDGVFLGG